MSGQSKSPFILSILPQLLGIAGEKVVCGEGEVTQTGDRQFTAGHKMVLRPNGIDPLPVFVNEPKVRPIMGSLVLLPRADAGYGAYNPTQEIRYQLGQWLAEHGWVTISPVFLGHEERSFKVNLEMPCMDSWGRGIRDLLWWGKTLAGEIVLDVLRVMKYFRAYEATAGRPMGLVSMAAYNLPAVCTALLDDSIDFVACLRCLGDYAARQEEQFFDSYAEYVPYLLKHTELSGLMGMLAPKPLFVSRGDDLLSRRLTEPLFKVVQRQYKQANASKMLKQQVVSQGKFLTGEAIEELGRWLAGRAGKQVQAKRTRSVNLGKRPRIHAIKRDVGSLAQWKNERKRALNVLHDLAGGFERKKVELDAELVDAFENDLCVRQTVRYRVACGEFAKGDFYLPKDRGGPVPAILGIHCHGGTYWQGRVKPADEVWIGALVKAGFGVFIYDQFGFGDRRMDNAINFGCKIDWFELCGMYQAMRGETVLGIMLRDLSSAVDYMQSRMEVDPERIGVTGYSMGGSLTVLAAVFDERLKAAVSVDGHYDERTIIDHAMSTMACHSFIPGQLQYLDAGQIAALIAPRPLLIGASRQDAGTPERGPQVIAQYCKRIYKWYDAVERFAILAPEGPHVYLPAFQAAAIEWFNRWL